MDPVAILVEQGRVVSIARIGVGANKNRRCHATINQQPNCLASQRIDNCTTSH